MTLSLDCQLSPKTARWMTREFGRACVALIESPLVHATDAELFREAANAGAKIITKDTDFADLVALRGPPPQVVLLTMGNTSDAELQKILSATLHDALALIGAGEPIVEIGGRADPERVRV